MYLISYVNCGFTPKIIPLFKVLTNLHHFLTCCWTLLRSFGKKPGEQTNKNAFFFALKITYISYLVITWFYLSNFTLTLSREKKKFPLWWIINILSCFTSLNWVNLLNKTRVMSLIYSSHKSLWTGSHPDSRWAH